MASVVRISAGTVALIVLAGVAFVWPIHAAWGLLGFLGTAAVLAVLKSRRLGVLGTAAVTAVLAVLGSRRLTRGLLIALVVLGPTYLASLALLGTRGPVATAPPPLETVDVTIVHGITVTHGSDGTSWERQDDVRIKEAALRVAVRDFERSERPALHRQLRTFIRESLAEEGWRPIRASDGLEFRRASTVEPPRTGSALLGTVEFDASAPELDDPVVLHPSAGSRLTLIARHGVIVATKPPTGTRQASVGATEVVTISNDGATSVQAEIVHPALAGMGPLVARLQAGQVASVAFAASWTLAAAVLPTAVVNGFKRLPSVFRSDKSVDREPEPSGYL